MEQLRSKSFDILLGAWTFLFCFPIPVLMVVGTPRGQVRAIAHIWVRGVFWMLRHVVKLTHTEHGKENVPHTPCILISNHQSQWETFYFVMRFPDIAIVAKSELSKVPIFGWYIRKFPMIIIERGTGSAAIRQMTVEVDAALKSGRYVLMFPEGTRKGITDPVEFKRGIEVLYSELETAIVPVALNSGIFWGKGKTKTRGTIQVSYLAPIMPGLSAAAFKSRAEKVLQQERDKLANNAPTNLY